MAISIVVATGYLCRHQRSSGFKLAIVVGYYEDRMRVRYWRANSGRWTEPTLVEADQLDSLLDADKAKHATLIERASREALKLVGRVWL